MHKLMRSQPCSFPNRLDLMGIRFFFPAPEGTEGGGGGGNNGEYTPPATQADLDRLLSDRAARAARSEAAKFEGFEDFKSKAEKWDEHEKNSAGKQQEGKDGEQPKGLGEEDVQKRIDAALADRDAAHAADRARDKLATALKGREFDASKLFGLDVAKEFVKDGNAVDEQAIADWVKDNSEDGPEPIKQRRSDPGQGKRDGSTSGGSVQGGRDRYLEERSKKNPRKD